MSTTPANYDQLVQIDETVHGCDLLRATVIIKTTPAGDYIISRKPATPGPDFLFTNKIDNSFLDVIMIVELYV